MTWRLLYVRPQSEGRYHARLDERGWTGYVPKEIDWRGVGPKRQPTPRPLLPGYVFADLTDQQLADAAHWPEVLYMIRAGDQPATIPETFVGDLQLAEHRGDFDRTRKQRERDKRKGKPIPSGGEFVVSEGLYKGEIGRIIKAKGAKRAQVFLSALKLTLNMRFSDLEAKEAA